MGTFYRPLLYKGFSNRALPILLLDQASATDSLRRGGNTLAAVLFCPYGQTVGISVTDLQKSRSSLFVWCIHCLRYQKIDVRRNLAVCYGWSCHSVIGRL